MWFSARKQQTLVMLLGSDATYATACINYPPEAGFLFCLRSQPPTKPLHKATESGATLLMKTLRRKENYLS